MEMEAGRSPGGWEELEVPSMPGEVPIGRAGCVSAGSRDLVSKEGKGLFNSCAILFEDCPLSA